MKHRKLLLLVCLVLALTMTLGGTLVYLTDVDSETNTFTMGKVDIELVEDFEQNANLWPGKQTNKDASIKNEGTTDAWVWMTVVVPANMKEYVTPVWANDTIKQNVTTSEDAQGNKAYTYLVPTVLSANTSTGKILDAMEMSAQVDIREIEGVDHWVAIVDGQETPIAPYAEKLDVTVYGYAVQVEGFADVQAAYDAYNAQMGITGGDSSEEPEEPVGRMVSSLAELYDAVKTSGTVVLTQDILLSNTDPSVTIPPEVEIVLNLGGKQLSAMDANNVVINNGTLTIKDGTVSVPNTHYAILNNSVLTIDGTTVAINGVNEIKNDDNAKLTVKGTSVIKNGIKNKNNVEVVIEGGTFGFDPTAYVDPTNYTITQNTDGTWTVTAK